MVTMVSINQMVIVDDTDNEMKYIICNPSTWNEHRPLR
jgi:putative methionine-R-sulfoxide reductase with GAF domain